MLAFSKCLLERVKVASIIVAFAEALPINRTHDFPIVIHSLPAPGVTAAEIIERVRAGGPAPVPGNQSGVAAAPQTKTVGHAPALAHREPVFDFPCIVV